MRRHGTYSPPPAPRANRFALAAVCAACLGSAVPRASNAQHIEGRVRERLTGRAAGAGFVVVLDSTRTELQRILTDAQGRFHISVRSGTVFLRSERIGFRAVTTEPIELRSGDTLDVTLSVERIPYALDRIEVSEKAVCGLSSGASDEMLVAWQEAEKALRAAVWTAGQRAYRYTVNVRDRRVRRDGASIRQERDSTSEALLAIPFRAPRPILLSGAGYVVPRQDGTTSYYAPDANVLLHDTFKETHCFSVVQDEGSVGLRFAPKPDRRLPDIRGAMWIDATTAHLQTVEFQYTGLDRTTTDRSVGGTIEFMAVPSGEWIVHRWHIRMPELGWVATDRRSRGRIRGYHDAMGEVLAIHDREGSTLYSVPPAVLQGTVVDSTGAQPLANARVELTGSDRATTTDADGRFLLSGPLRGRYTVTVRHPRLDSLGTPIDAPEFELEPGDTSAILLGTPSVETLWTRLCAGHPVPAPGSTESDNVRAVFGRVMPVERSASAEGVTVNATWRAIPRTRGALVLQDWVANATTDETGSFVLCGLPVETPIRLTAFDSTRISRTETIHFDRLQTAVALLGGETYPWRLPFWRRDISIATAPSILAAVTGRFVAEDGRSLAGVTVNVGGAGGLATTSDSSGAFLLDSVPPGPQLITVRRVGYRPVAYSATLSPGERYRLPPEVTSLVAGSGIELDPILVTAERARTGVMRGFEERRAMGFGDHLTRADFEDSPPSVATDLLRRMQGLRIGPNPSYGRTILRDGVPTRDTRRVVILNRRSVDRGECPMLVFLDGVLMGTTRDVTVDGLINVHAIEAIETYTGSGQVPAMFNVSGARCGVIVFWTR